MSYRQLPLPDQLQSDPEVAWNFWLMLHELSELLWDRHGQLFYQWARDDFGSESDRSPQACAGPPPATLPEEWDWPLSASATPPASRPGLLAPDLITNDDVPF